jgi:hypothetical protein
MVNKLSQEYNGTGNYICFHVHVKGELTSSGRDQIMPGSRESLHASSSRGPPATSQR